MRIKINRYLLLLVFSLAIGIPGATFAQGGDAKVRKDLKTVLALQGKACDEITTLKNLGENDYLVSCKDGHRYRIWIDANDRVIIEER